MNYKVKNGIYKLDFELSSLEHKLFREFEDLLEIKGFRYISTPSCIKWDSFKKQDLDVNTLYVDNTHILTGSAEQGILEYFSGKEVEHMLIYSKNQCFREENYEYEGLKRCKEFVKLEQFCFCNKQQWKDSFELLLYNAIEFLNKHEIEYRVIDVTNRDKGYHVKKYDIEVFTKQYGWLETHSCTYFGTEQSRRYNITGANHTISNTGIASPRILIPFIERM